LSSNPVPPSEPPIPKRRNEAALPPAQQRLLIESATGCWCLAPFLEVSAATGARRGEVLALRWTDFQTGAVSISRSLSQTKSAWLQGNEESIRQGRRTTQLGNRRYRGPSPSPRCIPPPVRSRLPLDLDLIFAEPDGNLLKPDSISSAVSALFKGLNIPKPKGASLHLEWHSHGSHLLAAGMELPAVSERLGHSSVLVTATVYAHRITGRDKEAALKWDEFQRSQESKEEKQ
jgi:integrase